MAGVKYRTTIVAEQNDNQNNLKSLRNLTPTASHIKRHAFTTNKAFAFGVISSISLKMPETPFFGQDHLFDLTLILNFATKKKNKNSPLFIKFCLFFIVQNKL